MLNLPDVSDSEAEDACTKQQDCVGVTSEAVCTAPDGSTRSAANDTAGGSRLEKRDVTEEDEPPAGWSRVTGSSCRALKCAVSTLHRLDDFNMEKIGSGFFSEVFKVTHKVTGSVMVLKMNLLRSNRPNMLKEVQLMNQLKHRNILKFRGVCVHEGQLHALTEYINGGSLEQLIQARSLELPYLVRQKLAVDIASGMEYLHGKGVFHRDLTSKNVLIKKPDPHSMLAVVGDFGLAAKIPDPKSKYRLSTVGSAYWMSPECLKGQWYNEKSDIFSYGIVLCELIARIEADPDVLPRTDNFGLDYLAFSELCGPCPPHFLKLAFSCCTFEPRSRPSFSEIATTLERLIGDYEEAEEISKLVNAGSLNNLVDVEEKSSMTARSEEVINKCASVGKDPCQHRKLHHRRSLSEDVANAVFPRHTAPSDKARCHLMTNQRQQGGEVLGVLGVLANPKHIGESMCQADPHYKPRLSTDKGSRPNPFLALSQFRGAKKIVGSQQLTPGKQDPAGSHNSELFSSCFELPSPFYGATPPSSPCVEGCSCTDAAARSSPHRSPTLSLSLPCSPTSQRKSSKEFAQLTPGKQLIPSAPVGTPQTHTVIPKKLMKSKTVPLIGTSEEAKTDSSSFTSSINIATQSSSPLGGLPSTKESVADTPGPPCTPGTDTQYAADHGPDAQSEVSCALVTARISSSSNNLLDISVDDSFLLSSVPPLKRRGSCESGFFSCVGEDYGVSGNEVLSACEYVLHSARQRQLDTSSATLSSSSAASSLFLMDDSLSTTTVSSLRSGSGDFNDVDDLQSRLCHHPHTALLFSAKRSSSLYTDSSEDLSTMGDLSTSTDPSGHSRYQSQQISKIVEYFERKQVTTLNQLNVSHRTCDLSARRRNLNMEFQKNIQRFDPLRADEDKIKWEGLEGKFKKSGMGLMQRKDCLDEKEMALSKALQDARLKKLNHADLDICKTLDSGSSLSHHHDICKRLDSGCSISDAIRKSKIELLRKSLERGMLQVPGLKQPPANGATNERGSTRPLATRLMICEGAVKSKLPLFDKK